MAAFKDYLDLRLAVSDLVGSRTISDVMPRLVAMAEADLNRKLRCRQMIVTDTLYFEEGEAQLPANYLEMIGLQVGPHRRIKQGSLTQARDGRAYAVTGSYIYLSNGTFEAQADYYARLTPLKCSPACTNWLLSDYPDVYLYAVALQAAKHLRDPETAMTLTPMLGDAVQATRVDDERAQWAQGVVRVAGVTP